MEPRLLSRLNRKSYGYGFMEENDKVFASTVDEKLSIHREKI